MKKILVVDNYDSFVYNIIHSLEFPLENIIIKRNDDLTLLNLTPSDFICVFISPGPMSPKEAYYSNLILKRFGESNIPVLGICLGHQCIGYVYNCDIIRADKPIHGKCSKIDLIYESVLFHDLQTKIEVGRYHSLIISEKNFNNHDLIITAKINNTIMAVQHKYYPIYGVQFHPESILSGSNGKKILNNFINYSTEIAQ